jgi:hypothetical protein
MGDFLGTGIESPLWEGPPCCPVRRCRFTLFLTTDKRHPSAARGQYPHDSQSWSFNKTPAIFTLDDETLEISGFASPECSGDKAGVVYL